MPSIKLRTCARTHISIGSNQSSKSWALVQAAECNAADFVLLLPMAWSPPAWQRRNRLGWTTRRLRHFQFLPTPLRHHGGSRKLPPTNKGPCCDSRQRYGRENAPFHVTAPSSTDHPLPPLYM